MYFLFIVAAVITKVESFNYINAFSKNYVNTIRSLQLYQVPNNQAVITNEKAISLFDKVKIFLKNRKGKTREPGRLILIRHGESELNVNGTFSGWIDCDLTETGKREMVHGAHLMIERGYTDVDLVYTSMLKRSIRSSWVLLKELDQIFRPVIKSWRLNQRMYGALEGVSYIELAKEIGKDKADDYRNNFYLRPPAQSSPYANNRRYKNIKPNETPVGESVADCLARTSPLFLNEIIPELRKGRNVLVVGHKNSLRSIIRQVDSLSDEQVCKVPIPNGIPFVYQFDHSMKPIKHDSSSYGHASFAFLENPKLLKILLKKENTWGTNESLSFKGVYGNIVEQNQTVESMLTPVMRGLSKLSEERAIMIESAGYDVSDFTVDDFDDDDGYASEERDIDNASSFDHNDYDYEDDTEDNIVGITYDDDSSGDNIAEIVNDSGFAGVRASVRAQEVESEMKAFSTAIQKAHDVALSSDTVNKLLMVNGHEYIVLIRHGKVCIY